MTDAHFHRNGYETFLALNGEEFKFTGIHPWEADSFAESGSEIPLPGETDGIGEIGLDRLKNKTISDFQRELFSRQLSIAAELRKPVVLHGAKCWGEVVRECKKVTGTVPAFLFHGFSRSTGLIPDIISLNGYISLGPALLNDHAVNYHEMAKSLPLDRIMLETDIDWSAPEQKDRDCPRLHASAECRVQSAESDRDCPRLHASAECRAQSAESDRDCPRLHESAECRVQSAESDRDCPRQNELILQMLQKLAEIRNCSIEVLKNAIDENVSLFVANLRPLIVSHQSSDAASQEKDRDCPRLHGSAECRAQSAESDRDCPRLHESAECRVQKVTGTVPVGK